MSAVSKIATRTVVTAAPGESVLDVSRRLEEHNVGSAVVLDEQGHPVGFVTDRDIAIRCVAQERDPLSAVTTVMSAGVRTIDESTPVDEALRTMAVAGHRRLVVTGPAGKPVGVLSVDDVVKLLAREAALIGDLLAKESPLIGAT